LYNQLFEIITENAPSHRGVVKIAGLVVSMVGIDNKKPIGAEPAEFNERRV
jgi:hypothetical protein